jgi:hypothetical protein
MEHLVLLFFIHVYGRLLRWSDSLFQRPTIGYFSPYDLEDLLSNPKNRLQNEPVVVGGKKRYGSAFWHSLLIAVPCLLIAVAILRDQNNNGPLRRPPESRDWYQAALIAAGIFFVAFTGFLLVFRKSRLELRSEGVAFQYGRETVEAPWDLFRNQSLPKWHTDGKRLVVPVERAGVKGTTCRTAGAKGEGRLRAWSITAEVFSPWPDEGPPTTNVKNRDWEFRMLDVFAIPAIEVVALLRMVAEKMPRRADAG